VNEELRVNLAGEDRSDQLVHLAEMVVLVQLAAPDPLVLVFVEQLDPLVGLVLWEVLAFLDRLDYPDHQEQQERLVSQD